MSRLALVLAVANVCVTLAAPISYDQQQTGDLNVQVHLKDIQIVALLDSGFAGDYGDYDYAYDYSDFTIKPIIPHATASAPSPSSLSTTSVEPWHSWPTISGPPSSSTPSDVGESQNVTGADQVTVNSLSQLSTAAGPGDKEPEKISDPLTPTPAASVSVETPAAFLKLKETSPASETITDNKDDEDDIKDKKDQKTEKNEKDEIAASPASEQPLQASVSSTEENPSSVEPAVPETIQAPIDQPQVQQTRKCSSGYTRDQKGRCRRTHIRRRVPSSLLPFGIRLSPRVHRHRDHPSETADAV